MFCDKVQPIRFMALKWRSGSCLSSCALASVRIHHRLRRGERKQSSVTVGFIDLVFPFFSAFHLRVCVHMRDLVLDRSSDFRRLCSLVVLIEWLVQISRELYVPFPVSRLDPNLHFMHTARYLFVHLTISSSSSSEELPPTTCSSPSSGADHRSRFPRHDVFHHSLRLLRLRCVWRVWPLFWIWLLTFLLMF